MNVGSGGFERPERANSAAVGEGWLLLSDNGPVRGRDPVAFPEVAFEPFKKISPVAGADDKYVATVVRVPFTAQITQRAKCIQGAGDHGLRNSEYLRKATHGVRPRGKINQHQQCHLPVRKVWFAGSDIGY